jgi:hypothetical protein
MVVAAASTALLVGAGASLASAKSSQPFLPDGAVVVARQLNNPRQLSLVEGEGALLVAEAGRGGSKCVTDPEFGETCVGDTGSVRKVSTNNSFKKTRVVGGLLSGAGPDGSFATGSDGVSARHLSSIFIQETFFPPEALAHLPKRQSGATLRYTNGQLFRFADITAFERAHDPDHQGFDSNPYSVFALRKRTLVTDAAGNSLLSVDRKGHVSLLTVFPNITTGPCAGQPNDAGTTGCDTVPTSIALGPNGHLYIGALAAEAPGEGSVFEVDPSSGAILKRYKGLTTVTGVAIGKDGSIYASELFGGDPNAPVPGQVTKILPNGTRKSVAIPFPAGLAVDSHNRLYVSAFSTAPGTGLADAPPGVDSSGQVWRLRI